jgi:hypothetical protein
MLGSAYIGRQFALFCGRAQWSPQESRTSLGTDGSENRPYTDQGGNNLTLVIN